MDMTGEYRIAAPRQLVWQALNDPDVLKQCIPGCEELEKHSDTEYTTKVMAKVGPVKARFSGKLTLSDLDPPNGYTLTGEGSGGAAGFGKGGATVVLADDGPGATLLRYTAHAKVGGKLAQIGSRLVDATARKMADDFFARFSDVVAPAPEEVAVEPAHAPGTTAEMETTAPAAAGTAAETRQPPPAMPPESVSTGARGAMAQAAGEGLRPAIWIGVVVAVAVILLLVLL